ncbi:MAG: hypothetical protein J1E63_05315 [Muribaculaceae bacterium]|nr:hypothetical protein [Muribaculaceae bacterium]
MTNFLLWFVAPLLYGVLSAGVYTWSRPGDTPVTRRAFLMRFIKFTAVAYFIVLLIYWLLT